MSTDVALLIIRLLIGLIMAAHGAQKLFGWFGGRGFEGAMRMTQSQRFRPALFWAVMAGLTELSGILIALGLLTPVGELGVIASMTMAIITVHWPRFFASNNGIEYPLVLLVTALAVAISGPGVYSVDALFRLSLPEPATLIVGLALVLLGTVLALGTPGAATASRPAGHCLRRLDFLQQLNPASWSSSRNTPRAEGSRNGWGWALRPVVPRALRTQRLRWAISRST